MQMLEQHRLDLHQDRLAVFLPQGMPLLKREIPCAGLDGIQLGDGSDELRCWLLRGASRLGNHRFRLDEITPAMRPATEMGQPIDLGHTAIDLVPVAHQGRAAFDAGIQGFGMGRASSTGVTEQPDRWSAAGGLCPQVTLRLRLLARLL